jgi:2-iminobutanoate/2-iminopropanoate deaminase
MRKIALLLAFALGALTSIVSAQADTITKKKWHWGGGTADTAAGYAQAVLVDNVLYVSGVPGRGTMAQQLQGAYRGIEATLKAYGLTFQHVVKENLYALDIEAVKANNAVRKAFYKGDYPAATWVQIARLYMPEALVEVEVIAHLPTPKGASKKSASQ